MPTDTPRILDLRRRVQADPASIAFAQLGEELRRAGAFEEAVEVCRDGLTRHPAYLSARVTLGRTLVELGLLDAAHAELNIVVANASDNLAAIRGLAEIHQRRGEMREALSYYRRALELARHDPELEETVERMAQQVFPRAALPETESVEALFDFDRLVEELGADAPAEVRALDAVNELPPISAGPDLPPDGGDDPLARLESDLRQRPSSFQASGALDLAPEEADAAALAELEDWLDALRSME